MILQSKKYPGLSHNSIVHLYGVEMPSLKDFISIIKTDEEITAKIFLGWFDLQNGQFSKEQLITAFTNTEPIESCDIFSEKFSNVEVRAAILKYVSPEKVFGAVESQVIETLTLDKKYPQYKIKGLESKKDSSPISSKDIEVKYVKRKEHYELIRITDKQVTQYLPWEGRRDGIYLLKMLCPSSKKIYYEYIDPEVVKNLKKGGKILASLCWQMRKSDGEFLNGNEYSQILSET